MATTIKDSVPGISTESDAGKQNPRRTDAVGVEIPVIVHASRNSVTSREIARPQPPVHEETRTVIVFPQGAVVRLTAPMTAGELVVLNNQRSGADVLCRVVSVKAQPGIQNYVDLEFTQRAPGFWGDCFPSEQTSSIPAIEFALPQSGGSFAPSLNKPAPPQLAPVTLAPAVPVVLPAVSSAPAAPMAPAPVHAPQATPAVSFSTLPAMRPEPESPAAASVTPKAPEASGSGLSLGLTRPAEQPQPWARSFESSAPTESAASGSPKMILMAVAAVVLLGAIGGGVVMLRKGSPASTTSRPAAPTQTAAQSLPASAVISPASSVVPQREAAAAPVAPLRPSEPVVSEPEAAPKSTALPKQPSRNAVARVVGKLSAPVAKKAALASSTEAPPVLPASAAAGPVGTGLLLSSDPNSGPVSPATLARNTTLLGGRVLEPKVISTSSPTYPPQATLQRVQGDVVVDALVDEKGRVTSAKAVSGSPLLQQAAVNAVRTWKYEPARLDGEAVAAHLQVKISFRLP
jgi:protein TonB